MTVETKEKWVDLSTVDKAYEGYAVSNLGRVRNLKTGSIVTGRRAYAGSHLRITMKKGDVSIPNLVLRAFRGLPVGEAIYPIHIDGNTENTELSNLMYGDKEQNLEYKRYRRELRSGRENAMLPTYHPQYTVTLSRELTLPPSKCPRCGEDISASNDGVEEWRSIMISDGLYEVSNMGRVRNAEKKNVLKLKVFRDIDRNPLRVLAHVRNMAGIPKNVNVEELVAIEFSEDLGYSMAFGVVYKNDNPLDLRLENLVVVSADLGKEYRRYLKAKVKGMPHKRPEIKELDLSWL